MAFVIPLALKDLENLSDNGQFRVVEVLTANEIRRRWEECRLSLERQGPGFILDNFDVFYSMLMHKNELDASMIQNAFSALKQALAALSKDLQMIFDNEDFIDEQVRDQNVNLLKMLVYITCQTLQHLEMDATNIAKKTLTTTGKGRGRIKQKKLDTHAWDWDSEKLEAIRILKDLVVLPIKKLWHPSIIEEEFLNVLSNCCYRCLENTNLNRTKELKETIFHLLGNLLKTQSQQLASAVKIVQLLQFFEHLAIPVAQAVVIFVKDYGASNILNDIIREIGSAENKRVSTEGNDTRSFSLFLAEVSRHIPEAILKNMMILVTYLDAEPYGMRNCVLGIMSEILLHAFPPRELDDKSRALRDQFLDTLEDHIHDINAFVRSRVLQLWAKLYQENAVPITRHKSLLSLVIGRLMDKACSVRKYAIQLLTCILQSNPFGPEMSLEQFNKNVQKEKDKLVAMCPHLADKSLQTRSNDGSNGSRPKQWAEIEGKIKKVVEVVLEKREGAKQPEVLTDLRSQVIDSVANLLKCEDYQSAVSLIIESSSMSVDNGDGSGHDSSRDSEGNDAKHSRRENGGSNADRKSLTSSILDTLKSIYTNQGEDDDDRESMIMKLATEAGNGQESTDVMRQIAIVHYFEDAVVFAELIDEALEVVCRLLCSRQTTDVLESVEFLIMASKFGVPNTMKGIQKMLPLIWSKEPEIKTAIVNAYRRLYIEAHEGVSDKRKYGKIVDNFTELALNATLGDLASLDELIPQLVASGDLDDKVFDVLLKRFVNKNNKYSNEVSNAAALLLGMTSSNKPQMIENNLDLLIGVGLGERAKKDLKFARNVCTTILKFGGESKQSVEDKNSPLRFPSNHLLFVHISDVIICGLELLTDKMWIPMMEQAMNVIYKLAEKPDSICEELIRRSARVLMKTEQPQSNNALIGDEDIADKNIDCPSVLLARFLALLGQVALCQVTHLEVSIFTEIKRRRNGEEKRNAKKSKVSKSRKHRQSLSARKSISKEQVSSLQLDDDEGECAVVNDDVDAEIIQKICDEELVMGDQTLLGKFAPVVIKVASDPGKYAAPELQAAASLALSRFMIVSSKFCDANMRLLVTIMERSKVATVRANTVIAMADLVRRFPNVVEPWTPYLYARLRDDSFTVQRNALIVLTQLILHDLVKVKGQISDVALCVVDSEERIASMSRKLFTELGKKGNAIYNLLPDIISRLSDPEEGTTEEKFQAILKYLLPFVQKDKLLENLVDKLCQRFQCTRQERQWRDLAFCISQLCSNDKCFRKLLDNIDCYSDKLTEPKVHGYFTGVIATAKKSAKTDKAVLDELEHKIEEYFNKGMEEQGVCNKASKAIKREPRQTQEVQPETMPSNVSIVRRSTRSKCQKTDENHSPRVRTNNAPSTRKKNRRAFVLSSSDSEDDDVPLSVTKAPKRPHNSSDDDVSTCSSTTRTTRSRKKKY